MPGKKGMKKYPEEIRTMVIEEQQHGKSVKSLSKKYGISRGAIQVWCGLIRKRDITNPLKRRGRPRTRLLNSEQQLELRIHDLEREVELYKSFLRIAGRM